MTENPKKIGVFTISAVASITTSVALFELFQTYCSGIYSRDFNSYQTSIVIGIVFFPFFYLIISLIERSQMSKTLDSIEKIFTLLMISVFVIWLAYVSYYADICFSANLKKYVLLLLLPSAALLIIAGGRRWLSPRD